jgi:hypothetical protein
LVLAPLLNPYVDAILLLALGFLIIKIMQSIGPFIAKIPWIGGAIAHAVDGMAQAISNYAGTALSGISDAIGGTLHAGARLIDRTYGEFRRHSALILGIAAWLPNAAAAIALLRAGVHSLRDTRSTSNARVKRLEKEYHGIDVRVKELEQDLRGIDETGLAKELNTIKTQVDTIRGKTLPGISTTADTAYSDVNTLAGWLGLSFPLVSTWTFANAVTLALGSLGLGNLSCGNFKSLLSKWACGLGTLLDDLLGIMIAGLALEAVCEFLPLLEDAFGAVAGPIVNLLNDVPLGACETPPAGWAQLSVSNGPLPPQQTLDQSFG